MDLASTLWLYYYPTAAAAGTPVAAGSTARRWRIGSTGTPAMRTLGQARSGPYVPPVIIPDPGGVALGSGDLTTAVIAWMIARHFTGDLNTAIRDYLATSYSSGQNEDLGTLVARLDDHNKEA